MKLGKTKPVISWTYERQREGFKIMQQKGCDALLPGVSQRIGQAFAASFPSFTPPSPLEFPLPSVPSVYTHTFTHVQASTAFTHFFFFSSGETQAFTYKSFTISQPSHPTPLPPPVSHSQVPILSSVCLLTLSIMQGLIS